MIQEPANLHAIRCCGLGTFATWPDELVAYFLANAPLSTRELLVLSRASKLMRLFVCEEPLWLQRHLDSCLRPFEYRSSWRATCLAYLRDCGRPGLTAADLLPPPAVPGFTSDVLYRRWYRCHVDLSAFLPAPHQQSTHAADGDGGSGRNGRASTAWATAATAQLIPQIRDASGMRAQEFEARFDVPRQPVLLGGLAAGWPGGLEAWQPASLARRIGDRLFKVTKPFMAGGRTKMRLADYLAYCDQQHDEEPLYIFDSSFAESVPELAAQYAVPHLFRHDVFACLGYRREDYRWLVVGPARSGASWHVDPSATSAWNTLLCGRKRWALYPPGRVPPGVQVHIDADGQPSFQAPTSLQWYLEIFPQLPPEQQPLELVQQAGDTIFVPAGWWHCVLNLEPTVAVTQNFVSPANLAAAVQWQALGAGSMFDPYLAPAFLRLRQAELGEGRARAGQRGAEHEKAETRREGPPAKRQRQAPGTQRLSEELPPRQQQQQQQRQCQEADACAKSEEQGDEEAAQRRAAAEEHLRELQLGFSKGGLLAPWLRQLLRELHVGGLGEGQAAPLRQLKWPEQPQERLDTMQQEHKQQQHGQQQRQLEDEEQQHQSPDEQCLADRVWELAQQWTEVNAWQPRLEAACRAAGLPPPQQRHEWLPLATGTCVVFEVAGAILKFFHPREPHSAAMAAMEATAYSCIEQGRGDNGSKHGGSEPVLLGTGLLEMPADWVDAGPTAGGDLAVSQGAGKPGGQAAGAAGAAAALPLAPLPFVAVSKSEGFTVGSCADRLSDAQWLAVADALGRSLAAFHSLPLPAAAAHASVGGGGGGGGGGSCSTAWVARDGIAYSSALGTTDLREEEVESPVQLLQRQRLVLRRLFPHTAALLAGAEAGVGRAETCAEPPAEGNAQGWCAAAAPAAGAGLAGRLQEASPACSCQRCRAWQPFLCFLRRQRRHAAAAHRRDGALPPKLLGQVETYLPADPAVLLGFGNSCSRGSSSGGVLLGTCASCRTALHDVAAGQAAAGEGGGGGALGANGGCGCGSVTSTGSGCTRAAPTWVHGDLTAENILLSAGLVEGSASAPRQGQHAQRGAGAVLIDFADSGQGDPLFDLVPLMLRTLRCNQAAAEAFMASYCAALKGTGPPPIGGPSAPAPRSLPACWPRRPLGTSLSHVAMCYTLLHELGPLQDVFKRRPELWEADSLQEVQAAAWGWLDRWFDR